jgi:hypothetical protein
VGADERPRLPCLSILVHPNSPANEASLTERLMRNDCLGERDR